MGLSQSPLASARSQRSCLPRNTSPCLCAWPRGSSHQSAANQGSPHGTDVPMLLCKPVSKQKVSICECLLCSPYQFSSLLSACAQASNLIHVKKENWVQCNLHLVKDDDKGIVGCSHPWDIFLCNLGLLSWPLSFIHNWYRC